MPYSPTQRSGESIRALLNQLKSRQDDTVFSALSALLSRIETLESTLRSTLPPIESKLIELESRIKALEP
jgi:hypothetical protein